MSDTTVKERPILFSAPMVRALLAGRKTQTRRLVKVPELLYCGEVDKWVPGPYYGIHGRAGEFVPLNEYGGIASNKLSIPCPYGVPGDRLYCKETWQVWEHEGVSIAEMGKRFVEGQLAGDIVYRADDEDEAVERWRAAIHMPRWASRLTLEVVSVRVERVQSISTDDAYAEGYEPASFYRELDASESAKQLARYTGDAADSPAKAWYRDLWNEINGDGSWEKNPWVWVVEFKVIGGGK